MSGVKSLSVQQSNQLLGWLTRLPWPVDKMTARRLAEECGWTVESDESGLGYETGYPIDKPYASFGIPDGFVSDVLVTVATASEPTPALIDLFADYVELMTVIAGKPVRRKLGKTPAGEWILSNGSEFRMARTPTSIIWSVTSPEFVQIESDLGRGW